MLIAYWLCHLFSFWKEYFGVLFKTFFAEPFIQSFSNQTNELGIFLVFQEPTSSIKMVLLVTLWWYFCSKFPATLYFLATLFFLNKRKRTKSFKKNNNFFIKSFFLGIFMGFKITLPLAMEWMIKLGNFLLGESFGLFKIYYFCFADHVSIWIVPFNFQ